MNLSCSTLYIIITSFRLSYIYKLQIDRSIIQEGELESKKKQIESSWTITKDSKNGKNETT